MKRYEFNTRRQGEAESIATYVAELRKIAEFCEYGPVLNDMLRDRLVCGTSNRIIQRRLLQESALTFEKALEVALSTEAADKDSLRLTSSGGDKDQPAPISKVNDRPSPKAPAGKGNRRHKPQQLGEDKQPQDSDKECHRCGGSHEPSTCPFKQYDCHFSKKKGHLARVCRKKGRSTPEKAHHVEGEETSKKGAYDLYHVNSGKVKPLYVTVDVNGNPLSMELDTGASVSIASQSTFDSIRVGESMLELDKSTVRLQTYTGEQIKVQGSVMVQVRHNGQTVSLPLIITEGDGPTLLGRNWLEALRLDWRTIFRVGQRQTLPEVLEQHANVFKQELGELKGTQAKIHVDDNVRPRFEKARTVPFAIREKVEEELERLQALGVIRPVQFSDWAAPIVPVLKGDGRLRICGDYKVTINKAAKLEKYPIPRIEELFASLAGGKTFSKLDLSHAYLQIPLDEASRQYVTINTHKGLFEYLRLPFGVASAPSIFQRVMENLLQGIPRVCVYIDDILVTGATEEEHLANLAQVLQRLESAGMRLKQEKCAFLLKSVSYLGHVISAEGLHTADSKVKAVVDAPDPRNISELRSFLGMVNYYGKFLPNLATTLSPLYHLLRQTTSWRWGPKQKRAFRKVKRLLKSSRVLTHFDDQLPLLLECDASPYGLGAVLSHEMPDGSERPICFASRTLTKAEQNYSHLDKEALAIIFGVRKYHQYLFGRPFQIKTDHKPLTHIFDESRVVPAMASGRIQRWALMLGAYDYRIRYRQGKSNCNADALSRLPLPTADQEVPQPAEVVHLMEHLSTTPLSSAQIRLWTDSDRTLSKVRQWVQEGWPETDSDTSDDLKPYARRKLELSVEGGCVLWGCRVVVPRKGRKSALQMLHEAHPGVARMKSLARGYIWWPGMDREIEDCVKSCTICQTTRKDPPVTPLHPWAYPEKPWTRIHIDYAGPLEGKMFLLIADAHSKWIDAHVTSSATSSSTIELLRRTFATLGLPEVLVSDNATAFTSSEFQEFLKKNGIRHVRTPPYHPASNGQVERVVQTFKEGMKRIKEGSLNTRLCRFLFKYRMTPHSSTGVSPAELMFGRKWRSQLDLLKPSVEEKARQAQDRQRKGHDAHARPRTFVVGETVYTRNYAQGPKWLPGTVVEIEGPVLLHVKLRDGRILRRHVDQVRPRLGVEDESPSAADSGTEDEPLLGGNRDSADPPTREGQSPPLTPSPETVDTETQEPVVEPTSEESDEPAPNRPGEDSESEEETEDSPPTVRRSNREIHPPQRFEEQYT